MYFPFWWCWMIIHLLTKEVKDKCPLKLIEKAGIRSIKWFVSVLWWTCKSSDLWIKELTLKKQITFYVWNLFPFICHDKHHKQFWEYTDECLSQFLFFLLRGIHTCNARYNSVYFDVLQCFVLTQVAMDMYSWGKKQIIFVVIILFYMNCLCRNQLWVCNFILGYTLAEAPYFLFFIYFPIFHITPFLLLDPAMA